MNLKEKARRELKAIRFISSLVSDVNPKVLTSEMGRKTLTCFMKIKLPGIGNERAEKLVTALIKRKVR